MEQQCFSVVSILCSYGLGFFISIIFPLCCFAGAWTPEKGQGQVISTLSYYSFPYTIIDGNNVSTNAFQKTEFSIYGEIGVTDSVTLGVIPRFQSQSYAPETVSGEIFIRKRFWQGEHTVFAVQPLLQLPGAYNTADYTTLNDRDYMQGELRLLAGYGGSYHNTPFFFDSELAYRAAFNGSVEEWRIDNSFGIRFLPRWLALMQLFGTYRPDGIIVNASLPTVDTWGNAYIAQYPISRTHFDNTIQFSVVHPITNTLSLQAGAFSHLLDGKEWLGNGFLLSVWVNF